MIDPKIALPSSDMILKTRRLVLRCVTVDDAPVVYSAVRSPRFPDRVPLKEMATVAEFEEWFRRLQEDWANGRAFMWTILQCESGQVRGQVMLSAVADGIWSMAFWTHPDDWGKGYATEAAKRLLAYGFEDLGAAEIRAGAGLWNERSIRVLEKLRMVHTGDDLAGYTSWGLPIATKEYAMSRERWQKLASE